MKDRRRAVFLDRDGTINEERNYLIRVEEFVLLPGVPEAIRLLREGGYLVIVVTNQSGVARGFFDLAAVQALHRHLQDQLARFETGIDALYICPHHPDHGLPPFRRACDCRKGEPGMLLQAAAEHRLDLEGSFMVGDKPADLEAGRRAGCTPLLVMTGYGRDTAALIGDDPVLRFPDLAAAARHILAGGARRPTDGKTV
jgi:D-glycero-D-manno-heptose 1,7-bisphosphate phosphatase